MDWSFGRIVCEPDSLGGEGVANMTGMDLVDWTGRKGGCLASNYFTSTATLQKYSQLDIR